MSGSVSEVVRAPTAGAEAKRAWVGRVLGVTIAPSVGETRVQDAQREIAKGLGPMTMAFRKARLSWGNARNAARESIASLQAELRETLKDQPDFAGADKEIAKFGGVMDGLDDRLEVTLDKALSGADEAGMKYLKLEAQKIIAEYTTFVEGHPFLRKIDGNTFKPIQLFSVLSAELQNLAKELG